MEDLKPIIAKNITTLRQSRKMTQIELAEQLNYSDKAISKWERGESVPDVSVLKSIADLFGVTVDYLLTDGNTPTPVSGEGEHKAIKRHNHIVVTVLSLLLVCFIATLTYVMMDIIFPGIRYRWLPFLYAVPVAMIVWLVFNSIWFNTRRNYLIISILMWSVLICLVVTLTDLSLTSWQLMLLGIPGQIIIFVWSRLRRRKEH
ncbi:MAG: helix-turn-helix transcriptional regulator [Oscillospiraceae bacterium]|nr:helix-turn-helix transcriptional regulator [Oscillospiraceae bacterium]